MVTFEATRTVPIIIRRSDRDRNFGFGFAIFVGTSYPLFRDTKGGVLRTLRRMLIEQLRYKS